MTISLGERNENSEVQAHTGDLLEISLPENATTGYRWAFDHPDPALFAEQPGDAKYPGSAPGSGGTAILRIRAVAPGNATLNLKYWRSFEGESGVIRRYSLKVHIS